MGKSHHYFLLRLMLIKPRAICSINSDRESCIDFASSSSFTIAVRVSERQAEIFTSEYISGLPLVLLIPFLATVIDLQILLEYGELDKHLLALCFSLVGQQQSLVILDRLTVQLWKVSVLYPIQDEGDTKSNRPCIQSHPVNILFKQSI